MRLNQTQRRPVRSFPISNGLKQGCALFSMMLKQATEDLDDEDKTQEWLIQDLLFADDAALIAYSERALQRITTYFAVAAQLFSLEVSIKKTEVLHQPAPTEDYHSPIITIGETDLKSVQQFTYLGCTISSDANIDKEIDNRLAKANSTFGRLTGNPYSKCV